LVENPRSNEDIAEPTFQDVLDRLGALRERFATSDQERGALDVVASLLPEEAHARVEGFVGHPNPVAMLGVHGVFILASTILGLWYPSIGAFCCLLVTASLVAEGTGRRGMLRWWLPRHPSYNLVVPEPMGSAQGTIVLTTPLDVPAWPMRASHGPRRPFLWIGVSAVTLSLMMLLRTTSQQFDAPLLFVYAFTLVVMAATSVVGLIARRGIPKAEGDPSGMGTLLQLRERLEADRPPGLGIWYLFTGCGRGHHEGIEAFLRVKGPRLKKPVLVVSLVDTGRAPLRATLTEGPLWPQHHRPTGPSLVERLRWTGWKVRLVDLPESTDARAASRLGYRAIGLVGGRSESTPEAMEKAGAFAEALVRQFAADVRLPAEAGAREPDAEW